MLISASDPLPLSAAIGRAQVKTHQFRINFAVAFDEVTSDAEMSEATALPRLALVDDQVTSVERLLDGLTAFQLLEKASALYLSYT